MKQLKYAFVAALVLIMPAQVLAGDGGYIQASYTLSSMGDPSAPYRGTSETYSLDDGDAYSASIGYSFMNNFAVELKVNYVEGDVDQIGGATARDGSEYNYAAATLGLLYRVDEFEIDKDAGVGVIPYVGLAVGYDGGYLDAQKDSEANCGTGGVGAVNSGCASGDNRNDYGTAVRASIGGLVELHDHIGVDINYDYIWGSITDNHFGSAGLRIMF